MEENQQRIAADAAARSWHTLLRALNADERRHFSQNVLFIMKYDRDLPLYAITHLLAIFSPALVVSDDLILAGQQVIDFYNDTTTRVEAIAMVQVSTGAAEGDGGGNVAAAAAPVPAQGGGLDGSGPVNEVGDDDFHNDSVDASTLSAVAGGFGGGTDDASLPSDGGDGISWPSNGATQGTGTQTSSTNPAAGDHEPSGGGTGGPGAAAI